MKQSRYLSPEIIHACGESMAKHKSLGDPSCYQLGYLDSYDTYSRETDKVRKHYHKLTQALEREVAKLRKTLAEFDAELEEK